MSVTTEDGGRLNAFAKEPRMEVMDVATSQSRNRSSMMTVSYTHLRAHET